MGIVFEAWQESLGRRVAVKVLPASVLQDDRAGQRFLREAQAIADSGTHTSRQSTNSASRPAFSTM